MKSVFEIEDEQEIEACYDLTGTRYWLARTGQTTFAVVGWDHAPGAGWYIRKYPQLTQVFRRVVEEYVTLGAYQMCDGARAVMGVIAGEAA